MKNLFFREWVPAGLLIRVLMVGFSLIVVIITMLLVIVGNLTIEDYYGLIISWSVLAFVLFLFWNYRGLEIKIDSDKLSIKYGIFNKKSIKISHISSCIITKASFGRYGGVGIRYGLDGSTAYTTSFGNAVEIVPKEGRIFVFSSNNPERICNIIAKLIE
jgi:hypothetical protein